MEVTTAHDNAPLANPQPPVVRFLAQLISYVFHPLFIPVYVTIFLMFIHPFAFLGMTTREKWALLIPVIANLTFFPLVAVFLMWRLKFVDTMFLRTAKERIIPYAVTMIFYFWAWYIFRNFQEAPAIMKQFIQGVFISIIGAWLCNIYFKISMHALAAGGMVCFIILVCILLPGSSTVYPSIAVLVAGLICTSRLAVSSHLPGDIYLGFFVGVLCQLLAWWI